MSGLTRHYVLWSALAVLLAGNFIQAMIFINHDVGWVLYSSGRLLDGGVFGRDIIAANPPLIWWVSAIPKAVASLTKLDAVAVFRFGVFCLSLVVLIDFYRTISDQTSVVTKAMILLLFAAIVSFGVSRDFGQREHLTLLLCIPYLTRAARLIETGDLPIRASWLVSIGVGIGIAFKPHFLLIPIFVELFIALRLRSMKQLIRADVLISIATMVAYVLAVLVFARPYLTEVIPSISKVYWGFSWPLSHILEKNIDIVALVAIALAFVRLNRFPPFATVVSLAALGFLCAALLQKKGYSYHMYPASALALVVIASTLDSANQYLKSSAALALILAVIYQGQIAYDEIQKRGLNGADGSEIQALVEVVQKHVPVDGNFFAISTHPFPGFPIANYASRDWLAATNSRIGLPAIIRIRGTQNVTDQSETLREFEQSERQAMLVDLSKEPELVLVDIAKTRHAIRYSNSKFDFLSFYFEDPAFVEIWEKYEEIDAGLNDFRSFILKSSEEQ